MVMEEKENFYDELDKKGRRSFCTCQTLVMSFVVVVVVLVFGVSWLAKKVTTTIVPQRHVLSTSQDTVNLQQKVIDLTKEPGASTELMITEQELTSLLIERINNQPTIPLRNIQAEINEDEIILSATATKFLQTMLSISVMPRVIDGKPKLELIRIQAGSLKVPAALTETIAKSLEDMLTQLPLDNIELKNIRLGKGRMIITGVIRSQPTPRSS